MADEISVAPDLIQSLNRVEWKKDGAHGLLMGRQWRGRLYVLNTWLAIDGQSSNLSTELAACQAHLCAGTVILGVVLVKLSKQTDVEKCLESVPSEVHNVLQSSPAVVVCVVDKGTVGPCVSFYRYSQEGRSPTKMTTKSLHANPEFEDDQVIFRIQARLPMQLQLDNSQPTDIEVWGEKMSKAFANIEAAITTGSYTFGFRNTHIFLSEGSVIGTRAKMASVNDLYNEVTTDAENLTPKKESTFRRVPVFVDLYQQVSGDKAHFSYPTCAPAIHQRIGSYRFLKLVLPVDVVVEVDGLTGVSGVQQTFSTAINTQLQAMQQCLLQHQFKENEFYIPEPFHFSVPERHTSVTVVYPKTVSDDSLVKRRQFLHDKMCLSMGRPVFRRANARVFPGQRAEGGYIINPHLGLPTNKLTGGKAHVVSGCYSYHHYMQDRFDDDKWGCAYRSLQTIVSWFRFQGYTNSPVPSHRDIQKALVDVGDKDANFIGSKKWIGSFEVSFVLEHLLGVTSKFLNVSAGAELASKGRELAMHFDTQGTPIMIGGGVLAHTILGVHYDEVTGDIKFLILDPHYTGGEDLPTIQREGWCGWKGPDFWNATAHYNLCMPQRPDSF